MIPEGITTSVFPRVYRRLRDVDVRFDRWQEGFGQVALGCREHGKYAASVGGVVASWPRQIGKTYTVGNLAIGLCLEFPGYRAIWTSHHNRTTTNTFRSMQSMVRQKKIWPHVAAIRTANGEQEIVFTNGSIIMFGAREQGFGRGMDKIDLEVFDEAQILGLKALEDMVPATNAAKHPHGGLVIFIGTPPRPGDDGEAFTAKRKKALDGLTKDQVYCEISADPDTDPDDVSQFGTFNPSYPHRTPLDAMLRMRENIPDKDSWKREAMGIWPEEKFSAVVSPGRWQTLKGVGPIAGTMPDGFGVDMSHDRQISIAACWMGEEKAHIEEVWAGPNAAAALAWLVDRAKRKPIVIDNMSPAAAFIPELKARRRNVVASSAGDMAKACGMFEDRAMAGTLSHGDQPQINDALEGAKKRDIRDAGGWGWDRRDPTKAIYPLVAATLALFGAAGTRRSSSTDKKPRKAVIG
ncbi:terminase [Gordonia rubripertincta]|uniref:terminase n=1 Tax=Gordonia rubripertincta TaxID=36822 RepID=UPI001FCFF1C9|nr:terminase [Gordonia rubripertincta]